MKFMMMGLVLAAGVLTLAPEAAQARRAKCLAADMGHPQLSAQNPEARRQLARVPCPPGARQEQLIFPTQVYRYGLVGEGSYPTGAHRFPEHYAPQAQGGGAVPQPGFYPPGGLRAHVPARAGWPGAAPFPY